MATSMIPSATSVHALSSLCGRGLVSRVPQMSQRFRPVCSRASCSSPRNGTSLYSSAPKTLHRSHIVHVQRAGAFSTSGSRNARPEDTASSSSKPLQNEPLPATTAKFASTLKSTLKIDNTKHENIYNLPNLLTLTRLIATPMVGYLIIHNQHLYAFSLFTYAAVSDLLDGWIARKWKLQTVVGSVVDPMADKFLMTTLVTCLAVNGSLPMPLFALILGRDASLAISALYYRYASLPAPKTLARYWDFSLPSAQVHPTAISKFNTFLQLTLLGALLCTNLLHDPTATSSAAGGVLVWAQDALGGEAGVKTMVQGMSAIVASTTIYSGLEYTWSKKAVVILGGDETRKRKQGFRGRMIMASGFGSFIALAAWLAYQGEAEKDIEEIIQQK
ncbi:cardiolipin synthetase [Ampelomyces quisqualis]|uniref:Cardiolipin synthetase n=1 Tax=Ampelomyces quisqualis TaxID=50730 RepID=A0A6A5QKY0_AMPQU|nr:cardiolipin synthetase [Ampelomyces quisqualis]